MDINALNTLIHRVLLAGERFRIGESEIPVKGIFIRQSGELAALLDKQQQKLHPVVVTDGMLTVNLFPHGDTYFAMGETVSVMEAIRDYNDALAAALSECRVGDYNPDDKIIGFVAFDGFEASKPGNLPLATEVGADCLHGGQLIPPSTRVFIFEGVDPKVTVSNVGGFNIGIIDNPDACSIPSAIDAARRPTGIIDAKKEESTIDGIALMCNSSGICALHKKSKYTLRELEAHVGFAAIIHRELGGTVYGCDVDMHQALARYNWSIDMEMKKTHVDRSEQKIAAYVTFTW